MSVLTAGANYSKRPIYEYIGNGNILPRIMVNIINGGQHANNNLDFQEFMIIPINKNINEQIRMCSEVYHTLKEILKNKGYNTNVGDEGGFAPNLNSNTEGFEFIMEAIKKAG